MKTRLLFFLCLLLFLVFTLKGFAAFNSETPALSFDGAWKQIFSQDGIDVYSQKAPDSGLLAFKATGTLNAPIDQIMEILRKVEISKEWMPDIEFKYLVKEFSDLDGITYSVNRMPWPFSGRELLLRNTLRLDRERKYLVIDIFSVEDPAYPVKKGNVRAFMFTGQTCMRPVGKQRTEILFMFYLDPRGYIPAWLVNMKQKTIPYNFLKSLEEKASTTHFQLRPAFQSYLDQLNAILGK
jgi:hypothetical protein